MRYIFIENNTVVLALSDSQILSMTPFTLTYLIPETINIQVLEIKPDTLIQRWPDAELCLYCHEGGVASTALDDAIMADYV